MVLVGVRRGRGFGEVAPRSHARRRVGAVVTRARELPRGLRCISGAVVVSLSLITGGTLWTSSALAISQRGHVFSFSFGSAGKGPGQLLAPSGVAVNDSTGVVYVADRFNNRVQEFQPQLNGQGEVVGEAFVGEFKVPAPQSIAVDNSTSEADPSKGDVYVSGSTKASAKEPEPEDKLVFKFTAAGTQITKFSKFKATEKKGEEPKGLFEPILGLAVDSQGNVYVYDEEGAIFVLSGGEPNVDRFAFESPFAKATPGLAVDAQHKLYAGHLLETEGPEGKPAGVGKFELLEGEAEREPEVISEQLDEENTEAVAVNTANGFELNDAYLSVVNTVHGEKVTTVASFDEHGAPIETFGAPGLRDGRGIAVGSNSGAVYVADAVSNKVFVFQREPAGRPVVDGISACSLAPKDAACAKEEGAVSLNAQVNPRGADTHAEFEYGPEPCATSGSCTKTPSTDLGEGFGDRAVSVEVQNLPPGTYHYRVVATNRFGGASSAERTFSIAASEAGLPDGRAWEMVSPPNKDGVEPEAIAKEGGTIEAAQNGRAFTYIADGPLPANGEAEGNRNPERSQILSARTSGGWLSQDLATFHSKGSGIEVGVAREYRAFSSNLSLGLVDPFPGGTHSGRFAEPALSPPLTEAEKKLFEEGKDYREKTVYLHDNAQIEPEAPERPSWEAAKANGERQREGGLPGSLGYLALATEANAPGGEPFGGGAGAGVEVVNATSDLGHVVLQSFRAAPGLYEWGPSPTLGPLFGSLQPVSVLPGIQGKRTGGQLGGPEGRTQRHAISSDGSRVFWTGEDHHLYVRDTVAGETLQLDTVAAGASGAGQPRPAFQAASADGSKVFFTDTQRLTPDSKASEGRPDLYVFEMNEGRPPSGALRDLTPEGIHGESAAVVVSEVSGLGGGVLGASEDGSYVYFVANGALSAGASPGHCTVRQERAPLGSICNLYVRHYDGTQWTAPKLIAALSDEDAGDWAALSGAAGDLTWMTSRVSPNGRFVAFMSNRSLTGYNNEDVTSQAPRERVDEEVFVYDASAERLVCASCNPSGARPAGVLDTGTTGEGAGGALLVDQRRIWSEGTAKADHWLAGNVPGWTGTDLLHAIYQSRYLSDEGRLFFNSPDHLVPAATGAREKVYEYEPKGVGGCTSQGGCIGLLSSPKAGEKETEHESTFLDASASGNDVFFLSAAKLVPQDVDTSYDVYDARLCEASSPCLTPPPPPPPACDEAPENPCKAPPTTAPAFAAPGTITASGPGNVASVGTLPSKEAGTPKPKQPSRAQLLAKALKACHAKKDKKRRLSCERQARKRYGRSAKKSRKASRHSGRRR
jgi:DNA-binding beta-propeller fold protein YncE